MDVEKTITFLLENQARLAESLHKLNIYQIEAEEQQARHSAQAQEQMAAIRAELRRAVQMGVEEARRERQRRHDMHDDLKAGYGELKASIAELATAQQVTEEKLQRLIDHLDRRT